MASQQIPTPGATPGFQPESGSSSPASYANHQTSWTPVDTMTPISTNPSRKRSRDETAFENEDGSYFSSQQVHTPATIPEEPIYGEGMVLLNPQTGMAISAESQTGTWYEEKADEEAEKQAQAAAQFRPIMPTSRKSIRLSQSNINTVLGQELLAQTQAQAANSPPKSSSYPEIDEATMILGIGWAKIASDETLAAAARGWARYLENHYANHVHGAEILLKSTGLNAYLVGAQEGFFLFAEDLLQGQLLGRTWETAFANLTSQPISFEGAEVLRAESTPGPEIPQQQVESAQVCSWAELNHEEGGVLADGGMDLDG